MYDNSGGDKDVSTHTLISVQERKKEEDMLLNLLIKETSSRGSIVKLTSLKDILDFSYTDDEIIAICNRLDSLGRLTQKKLTYDKEDNSIQTEKYIRSKEYEEQIKKNPSLSLPSPENIPVVQIQDQLVQYQGVVEINADIETREEIYLNEEVKISNTSKSNLDIEITDEIDY